MIKFRATGDNGKTIIGLGITEGNVRKLKEGKTIVVWLQELGIEENIEVCIFYGETEQKIYDQFEEKGLLEGTIIHKEHKKI